MTRWSILLLAVTLVAAGLPLAGTHPVGAETSTCEALLDGLQDDAGSGSDAGDTPGEATPIDRYVPYGGLLLPAGAEGAYEDRFDVYTFQGDGDGSVVVNVTSDTPLDLVVTLVDPFGRTYHVPRLENDSALVAVAPALGPELLAHRYQLQVEDVAGPWLLIVEMVQVLTLASPVDCEELYARGGGGGTATDYGLDVCGCHPECQLG